MLNKRGQGLQISTIILIILGLAVLVLLITGFMIGWQKILPWISSNNVDTVVNQCQVACATGGAYNFCNAPRDLNSDSEKLESVTCYYLAEKKPNYGVSKCESITCTNTFVELVAGETLDNKCASNNGKTIQALVNSKLETKECPVA